MEETKTQDKPESSSRGVSESRIVGIEFNPGPDAEDRLRRLFTLLVKYATEDNLPAPDVDSSVRRRIGSVRGKWLPPDSGHHSGPVAEGQAIEARYEHEKTRRT